MTQKRNLIIIPFVTILVAALGSFFTQTGMDWYDTVLVRPALTPPKWLFPIAWTTIFICTTISALMMASKPGHHKKLILSLFAINAVLNVSWTLLFFKWHALGASVLEIAALELTNIALFILCFKNSKLAGVLLLPYVAWVGFASYLTYQVFILNS